MAENNDKLPTKVKLSLAQGLTNVEAFSKAAEILDAIRKAPSPAAGDEAEIYEKYQRQAQVLQARNYRSAKDYGRAIAVFDEMIGKKDKRWWAYGNLQVRREKVLTMEEMAHAAPEPERAKKWVAAVQEWNAIAATFPASKELLPFRKTPKPEEEAEEARKSFLKAFTNKSGRPNPAEGSAVEAELACVVMEFAASYARERDEARKIADETAPKRSFYFDLAFEQKRCSVMAYKDLGLSAYDGKPAGFDKQAALEKQYASFAKFFHDVQTKNPDLAQSIKDRIADLVASVPELKKEYDNLRAGGK
jgi:hypothetical protein